MELNYQEQLVYARDIYIKQSFLQIDYGKLLDVVQTASADILNPLPNWDWYLPNTLRIGKVGHDCAVDIAYFLYITTAINFGYWEKTEEGFSHWEYNGALGATGMANLMLDIYDEGLFPRVKDDVNDVYNRLKAKFESVNMPHAEERAAIIKSLVPSDKFILIFRKCADNASGSGCVYTFNTETAWELMEAYPFAYMDPFAKKSQLLFGLLAANFHARGWKVDVQVTAYADYRIPQVLRHLGILEYHDELRNVVDNQIVMLAKSDMERAIRAATVVACRVLAEELSAVTGKEITEVMVDAFLFMKTREDGFSQQAKPFHLCYTSDY